MRNFDERKQEILRREEARIQYRKKVKKTLLGSGITAVCLCLVLGVYLNRTWKNTLFTLVEQDQIYAESSLEDMPAADEPAVAAPTQGYDYEDMSTCDCIVVEAPAELQPWEIPPENTLIGTPGESFTEYEGVCVQVDEFNLARGSMCFDFWNQSGEDAYLDSFDIVHWEENQWVSCAIDKDTRTEPQWLPSYPDETAVGLNVIWRDFDFTRPGAYRFIGIFRVGEDENQYTMWTEFTLAEPKLIVDELGAFGSDYPGVYLEFSNIFLEEGRIQAFWRNETELPARIYEGYDLQYLEGDIWVSCKKEYPQFGENIYELAPWPSHVDMDYSISPERFDLSQAGEYRLTAQFWVEGDDTLYTAWAWFTLSMQKQ